MQHQFVPLISAEIIVSVCCGTLEAFFSNVKHTKSCYQLRSAWVGAEAVLSGSCSLEHWLVSRVSKRMVPSAIEGSDEDPALLSGNIFGLRQGWNIEFRGLLFQLCPATRRARCREGQNLSTLEVARSSQFPVHAVVGLRACTLGT